MITWKLNDRLEDLDATDAQKQSVNAVKDRLFEDGKRLAEEHQATRLEVLTQLESDTPDAQKLHGLVDARLDAVAPLTRWWTPPSRFTAPSPPPSARSCPPSTARRSTCTECPAPTVHSGAERGRRTALNGRVRERRHSEAQVTMLGAWITRTTPAASWPTPRSAEVAEYGRVTEAGKEYPLFRLTVPGRHWLVITSGVSRRRARRPADAGGELRAGGRLCTRARRGAARLPVHQPFRLRGRHPLQPQRREAEQRLPPLRDRLRARGRGERPTGESFLRWVLYDGGPKETRAVRADIVGFQPPAAALDIHQDNYLRHGRHVCVHVWRRDGVPAVDGGGLRARGGHPPPAGG